MFTAADTNKNRAGTNLNTKLLGVEKIILNNFNISC